MESHFFSKQILLISCENVGNNHRGQNFTSILVRRQKFAFVHALFTSWNKYSNDLKWGLYVFPGTGQTRPVS